MKTLIYIILAALLLSGCVTPERCAKFYPPRTDSIVITKETTIYRDTTIYIHIKPDTVIKYDTVVIINGIAESRPIWLNTEFARSLAQVRGGKLISELYQKDSTIMQVIEDAVKFHSKETIKEVVKTVQVETNILSGWQWAQVWMGRGFMLLIVVFIGVLIVKMLI